MTFMVLTDDTQNINFRSNHSCFEEPTESNICLEPLCGDPYPFFNLCPYRYNQIVSCFGDSSRQDEQDEILTTDEKIYKKKTWEKLVIPMHPNSCHK